MEFNPILYSCPGKILVVGGYSILFEQNSGISLAVDSKYYVNIINKPINKLYFLEINFFSLQFDESWSFIINKTKNSFDIIQTIGKTNLFLEAILKVFICFILNLEEKIINIRRCLNIFIFFDSYFYSTKNIKEKKILEKDFRLGSSASLIISCLAALIDEFHILLLKEFYEYPLLHILAQLTNIIAQNKIGSGFDISTSLFGSQNYTRFPESLIPKELIENINNNKIFNFIQQMDLIIKNSENSFKWDIAEKISIPFNFKIILIDFTTGSDTRLLVSKVKQYLDNNKAQKETFLQKSQEFCNFFKKYLNENMSELEKHIFKEKSKDYRNILKSLGEKCGVEIEPDTITLILDYISNISKIIYSICPGAGGYDAACCLVENDFNSNIIKEKINELKQLDFFNSIEIKKILENNNIIKNIQPIFEQLKNFEIEVFEIPICQTGLLRHEVFDQEFTSKLYEYSKLKIEL